MTVYIDHLQTWPHRSWRYGRSAHLLPSHPGSAAALAELHAFAQAIGLRREWFQRGRWPHYDVTVSRHAAAVRAGAVLIETRNYIRAIRNENPLS